MSTVSVPAAVLARAQGTARALTALSDVEVDAGELLGGRAAMLGLQGHGQISAGGATQLMGGPDGWCALALARPDDIAAVPALLESDDVGPDPWPAVRRWVAETGVGPMAHRARLLGLPVGVLGETAAAEPRIRRTGVPAPPSALGELLVADLSSMWAGPLCTRLLARAGATVVKVESSARPDGTRAGPPAFFDWINSGKLCYRFDLDRPDGLRKLLAAADVVVESSRPAGLARRGLGPDDGPARPGRIWLRITGHGAVGECANWVAFGDDAAVSGGLVSGGVDAPQFCGDAIADPLTGLHAATAILQSNARGGAEVIDVSMAAVAANYALLDLGSQKPCTPAVSGISMAAPAARLGADNETVDRLVTQRLVAAC